MPAFSLTPARPRTLLSLVGTCLAAAFLACTAASAHDFKTGALEIGHPWTRATPPSAKVGGGYLTVKNTGSEPDRLTGVETDASGKAEIHEMKLEGGVMQMRPVPAGLEIKPGETITLAPGGFHVMFMGLKEPLKEGALVKGTLVFEKAGRVPVEFKVEPIGATPATGPGGNTGGHGGHGAHGEHKG